WRWRWSASPSWRRGAASAPMPIPPRANWRPDSIRSLHNCALPSMAQAAARPPRADKEFPMAQMTVRINGYAYTVGCEDGQEAHLQAMAEQVENRIASIKAVGGQSGEARLLALASLLLAD